MAFLNKEQVERYASVAHLDLSGMTWQQKQKVISEHMRRNDIKDPMAFILESASDPEGFDTLSKITNRPDNKDAEIARLKAELEQAKADVPVPQVPVVFERGRNVPTPTIEDYENAVLIASPEQRPQVNQRAKWYENIGTQKNTKDVSLGVGKDSPFHGKESGVRNATYMVEDTGRPLQAQSTMPKYSAMLTYRPTKDLVAKATYENHEGYLWQHQRLPNVVDLLKKMGAYEEFKDEWNKEIGRKFYLGGLICCNISFTDYMIEKIQKELRKRGDD